MATATPEVRPTTAPFAYCLLGWMVFAGLALILADALPPEAFDSDSGRFLLLLGFIASWRYSWQGIHLCRSVFYRHIAFPKLRRRAEALAEHGRKPNLYILVTSFRLSAEENRTVYRALFRELANYGAPATIVASVTDAGDEWLLERMLELLSPPDTLEIVLMQQAGTGKRDAMAAGLRAISRRDPPPQSIVVLMDGDTVVMPDTFDRSVPFFRLMPELGALTVDNRAITTGNNWVKEWYELRLAQRHIYMSSISLSHRLLVLTGRFSMFRADIATDPDFIDKLERDEIDHWRLGRVKFLTGDDKSTWFWALKRGWAMLYLPDVQVLCLEELPNAGFFISSLKLMNRWFGNMLRNNGRALALGPVRMGFFTWWCLMDQRLSIWTTLSGPVFAALFYMAGEPAAVLIYLLWVMVTRFGQSVVVYFHRGRLSPYFPPLLAYTQIVGAAVKLYTIFRLDRQSWTRQGIRTVGGRSAAQMFRSAFSIYLNTLAVAILVYAAAVVTHVLPAPGSLDALGWGLSVTAP